MRREPQIPFFKSFFACGTRALIIESRTFLGSIVHYRERSGTVCLAFCTCPLADDPMDDEPCTLCTLQSLTQKRPRHCVTVYCQRSDRGDSRRMVASYATLVPTWWLFAGTVSCPTEPCQCPREKATTRRRRQEKEEVLHTCPEVQNLSEDPRTLTPTPP